MSFEENKHWPWEDVCDDLSKYDKYFVLDGKETEADKIDSSELSGDGESHGGIPTRQASNDGVRCENYDDSVEPRKTNSINEIYD